MRILALAAFAASLAVSAIPSGAKAQSEQAQEAIASEAAAAPEAPRRRAPTTIWQVGSGINFSTGDYGGSVATDLVAVPLNLRVSRGGWSFRLAASYLVIDGPASVVDVIDDQPTSDGSTSGASSTNTRSGIGDLSLTLARRFDLTETTRLTGDVRLKLPTGSESQRLTTGTTDVTLRARLSQEVGDVTLRAGVQRRFAGGEGRVQLRDTWGASAGASLDLGSRIVGGVDFDWRQSSYSSGRANTSMTAYLSAPLNRRIRLTGYAAPGLSTNSADITVGASLTVRVD